MYRNITKMCNFENRTQPMNGFEDFVSVNCARAPS